MHSAPRAWARMGNGNMSNPDRAVVIPMAAALIAAVAVLPSEALGQRRDVPPRPVTTVPVAAEIVLESQGDGPTVRLPAAPAPVVATPMSPPFPPEAYRRRVEQPRAPAPTPPARRAAVEGARSAEPAADRAPQAVVSPPSARQDHEEGPSASDVASVQARILALQAELERHQAAPQVGERDDLAALPPSSEAEPSPIARPELRTPEAAAPPRSARPRITEHPPRRMWVRSNARVRAGPSTEAAQVASLNAGTEVEVLGSIDGGEWYWLGRDSVGFGYIAGFLLSANPPTAPRTAAPTPPPTGAPVGVRPDRHGACPAGTIRLRLGDGSPICARFN